MIENRKLQPAQIIGPLGELLTLESLTSAETKHWTIGRKAEVVAAVSH